MEVRQFLSELVQSRGFGGREDHSLKRNDLDFGVCAAFSFIHMFHDSLTLIVVPELDGENQRVLYEKWGGGGAKRGVVFPRFEYLQTGGMSTYLQ